MKSEFVKTNTVMIQTTEKRFLIKINLFQSSKIKI